MRYFVCILFISISLNQTRYIDEVFDSVVKTEDVVYANSPDLPFLFLFEWQIIGQFQKDVDWLFWACVKILQVWGDWTGLGYNLLNILIFIILQPVLILLFFVLWRLEVSKHKRSKH